jgi:hypothetical protein
MRSRTTGPNLRGLDVRNKTSDGPVSYSEKEQMSIRRIFIIRASAIADHVARFARADQSNGKNRGTIR